MNDGIGRLRERVGTIRPILKEPARIDYAPALQNS
jgi:hypothetical protein